MNYLTILSFKKYHKDWKIHIYYTSAQSNSGEANWKTPEQKLKLNDDVEDYWDRLKEDRSLNLICVDEFIRSLNLSHLNIVQQSDILRIYILYTYGGVYSDFDIIYIRNIEPYFIPHQQSNILFFGIEPNGYIYFPVGFFITMPRQESYKKIITLVYFFKIASKFSLNISLPSNNFSELYIISLGSILASFEDDCEYKLEL